MYVCMGVQHNEEDVKYYHTSWIFHFLIPIWNVSVCKVSRDRIRSADIDSDPPLTQGNKKDT